VLARYAAHPVARVIVHLFMAAQVIVFIWLIAGRISGGGFDRLLPRFAVTNLIIWHFIGLGMLLAIAIVSLPIVLLSKMVPHRNLRPQPLIASNALTRRDFLRFAAAISLPLSTEKSRSFCSSGGL
jgi:hypothetical protein